MNIQWHTDLLHFKTTAV